MVGRIRDEASGAHDLGARDLDSRPDDAKKDNRSYLAAHQLEPIANYMVASRVNIWLQIAVVVSGAIYKSLMLVGVAAGLNIAASLMERPRAVEAVPAA